MSVVGPVGETILDELIEKDLAYLNPDGRYHLFQKFFQINGFESNLKQLNSVIETVPYLDPEWRSVNIVTKSYSPKGFVKAREAENRFIEELEKLESNPDCNGVEETEC